MTAGTTAGFVSCAVATVFFGSMFVPLKKFDCGDGMYVQWVMSIAIFVVGVCVNAVQCFPKFYPLAMVGGALWATGNVTAVPIINCIGMTLGILLWSFTNLLSGWASGRFGWFGLHEQIPPNEPLNYAGLVLSLISTIMFAFVKNRDPHATVEGHIPIPQNDDRVPILPEDSGQYSGDVEAEVKTDSGEIPAPTTIRRGTMTFAQRRMIAIGVSLIAGVFYGLCFAPVIWIQDNVKDASKNALDYVFAHYCGILLASTTYFLTYAMAKKNKPVINAEATLAAFLAGVMWGIAQTAFFIANEALLLAVSFPIITRFPGIVSALWGVLLFKEIRGTRNLKMLCLAILITVVGGVLSGLSHVIH